MKRERLKQGLGGLLVLSAVTVLTVMLFQNRLSSQKPVLSTTQLPVATNDYIPPPPPLIPKQSREKLAPYPTSQRQGAARNNIFYDENLSFDENLRRLKEFCRANRNDAELQQMLVPFLQVLFEQAPQQYQTVTRALDDLDGSPAYRNLLLACLMTTDRNAADKANLVWQIALDSREPVEVRRTASFLMGQLGAGQKRPGDLYTLLADEDSQVVLFAIENSAQHLDQRNYDLIRTKLVHSSDIHLQVASVNAIGKAPFADSQATLASILANVPTSKAEAFSEASLVKRAAIVQLDMLNPEFFEAVKQIALDDNEDPGVRAKAIGRFTPTAFPKETDMLVGLLKKLDAGNTVSLRAVVDTLLTAPTAERIQMIRTRAQELTDPQVSKLLLARIRIATEGEGGNP